MLLFWFSDSSNIQPIRTHGLQQKLHQIQLCLPSLPALAYFPTNPLFWATALLADTTKGHLICGKQTARNIKLSPFICKTMPKQ